MENSEKEQLWADYQATKDPLLREKLILEYSPIVRFVAGRLAIHLGQHMDFDDLISYGIFGLIDAIDKFDLLKGVKFETYASLRIRGSIIDNIRNLDWVPRTLRQKHKKFEQAHSELENHLGRAPTEQELANKLEMTIEETRELERDSNVLSLVSLDDYLDQNNDTTLTASSQEDTPEGSIGKQEMQKMLTEAIEKLTEKERMVVTMHYFEELTLREISKVLKVSESRVSQIHSKAMLRMQGHLGEFKTVLFS